MDWLVGLDYFKESLNAHPASESLMLSPRQIKISKNRLFHIPSPLIEQKANTLRNI